MDYGLSLCNNLHDDHMATVRALEDLETTLTRLGPKAPPDVSDPALARQFATLAATMKAEIACHFAFEEDRLFPLVRAFGDTPMLMVLQDEHDTIRPLAAEVADAVRSALAGGFTPESWAAFYDLGLELVERETFHIQKEEMALLPMLDQIVDPDQDGELSMALGDAKAG